jgi:APA family basic amino acid/polyamine antiporter
MTQLQKTIGLWSATTIVIGSVIGSGIFMKPATMASQLGSPYLLIIVWIVAGFVSLFGAMAFAELGTMFPETGGQYVYLRKAYGDFIAYLYGWGSIAVINTAAIAAIAFVCAAYAGNFVHLPRFDNANRTFCCFTYSFDRRYFAIGKFWSEDPGYRHYYCDHDCKLYKCKSR